MIHNLNQAIDSASNVKLKEGADWWFSRESQRKYIFTIAAGLVTNHDVDPKSAIDSAEELVQLFYTNHVQTSTRKP